MKYYILFFVMWIGVATASGQGRLVSAGLTFSGDYTKAARVGGDRNLKAQQVIDAIEGKFGFTAGIAFSFQRYIGRSFDIGVMYMRHHEQLESDKDVYLYNTTPYMYTYTIKTAHIKEDHYMHMISLPINWVSAFYSREKMELYASFGLAPTLAMHATSTTEIDFDGYHSTETDKGSKFYKSTIDNLFLGGAVALGVSYHPIEEIDIRIAPTFRIMTTITGLDEDYQTVPYFLGLNTSVFYRL